MDFWMNTLGLFLIVFPFQDEPFVKHKVFNIELEMLLPWLGCALVALNTMLLLFN